MGTSPLEGKDKEGQVVSPLYAGECPKVDRRRPENKILILMTDKASEAKTPDVEMPLNESAGEQFEWSSASPGCVLAHIWDSPPPHGNLSRFV